MEQINEEGTLTNPASNIPSSLPVIPFGKRVSFTHKYVRVRVTRKDKMPSGRECNNSNWKVWNIVPYEVSEGIFLGFRTLKNGTREWDSQYGWSFEPKESFRAALVAPSAKLNPVFVPMDCLSV